MEEKQIDKVEDALYQKMCIQVDKGQASLRIDKFLMHRLEGASRNQIQKGIEREMVLVNNNPVKNNYKIKPYDTIIIWNEGEEHKDTIIPENIPLEILFEDEHLLLVNKPAGMVVHQGCGNYSGTLLNALAFYFEKQRKNITEETLPRLGLVHRIDKNTSGILVIGKDIPTIKGLIDQFAAHTIHRKYIALVWGNVSEDKGIIKAHVGRHLRYRKIFDAYPDGDYGKYAVTHYQVVERLGYLTLLHCRLETGRTHQIRVHFKYLGHPLFSDDTYGGDKILKGTIYKKYQEFVQHCFRILPRQALHAGELGFIHPITKKSLFFESPLPNDFSEALEKWRFYVREKFKNANEQRLP